MNKNKRVSDNLLGGGALCYAHFMLQRITLLLVLTLSSCAHSTPKKPSKSPPLFSEELINVQAISSRLEAVLSKQIGANGNVGAVVGVYHGGQIKFLSLGEVKKGTGKKPDENTIFEIGSITKTMTGLLLADAIEENKVKDDATLGDLKKSWQNSKVGEITLEELATHRSGLPRLPCNLKIKNELDPYADYSETNLLDGVKDSAFSEKCKLEKHPTEKKMYSNWGASLLGYALASAQKTKFQDLFQKKISKSFELTQTTFELSKEQKSKLAQGYDEKGNEVPIWHRQALLGQGGVFSNATDLMNYAQGYLHPDVTPFAKAIKRSGNYFWNKTRTGSLWHNGETGGYSSLIKIYPAHDLAVFYLSNTAKELKCFIQTVESTNCED
jgi:CubicO group peptidase (beta-lactamase class C family)